ncbi:hypothetical protein RchiOBHm_Chr5g0018131 [Rosa chinensis]|uniref:Uncharacterized protein n=1 Tax=Rosa chinensis TaxID=74649 RepID=A0A2P6Q6L9_ROSCH|nr:hypothetical protein RchiOBHm_Chr5g0018131 [Rosa chinensis]
MEHITDEQLKIMSPEQLNEQFRVKFRHALTSLLAEGDFEDDNIAKALHCCEQAATKFAKGYIEKIHVSCLWVLCRCMSLEECEQPIGQDGSFMSLLKRGTEESNIRGQAYMGSSTLESVRLAVTVLGTTLTFGLIKMKLCLTLENIEWKMRKMTNAEALLRFLNESFEWEEKSDEGVVYNRMIRSLEQAHNEIGLIPNLGPRELGTITGSDGLKINLDDINQRHEFIDRFLADTVSIATKLELLLTFPLLPNWQSFLHATKGNSLDWLEGKIKVMLARVEVINSKANAFIDKYEGPNLEVLNFQRKMTAPIENMWQNLLGALLWTSRNMMRGDGQVRCHDYLEF